MVFLENSHLGQMGHFGLKISYCHKSRIDTKEFFEISHNLSSQEVHENYINGFSEEISFSANGSFWTQEWCELIGSL